MATNTNATSSKPKKAKKPPSPERLAAMARVDAARKTLDAAKSPQEKSVAQSSFDTANDALKSLRFSEIGAARINQAVNILRKLENVANPAAYKWTPEQAEKASTAINLAVKRFTDKLARTGKAKTEKFTF